ncbi:MAG TPA: hypothetical protein VFX59_14390, partial [Polyangiales bacterium]|nr:hypothetical protein [Polyangiales bacterium]
LLGLLLACGDDAADESEVEVPAKLALVADWFNGSISYVDAAKLATATTRAELVTSTIDLAAYPPGPVDVALTPDKKTALVSSSTGFFAIPASGFLIGATSIPTGPGKLLMLDVASGAVTATLEAGPGPMAIQITPDGKRAIAANFGSGGLSTADGTLVVIDLENKKITETIPAGLFPEELAFDDSGTVAIFGFGDAGSLRTFSVADPKNTLSPEIELAGDSAGVAFFPGTKIAFGVQAPAVAAILTGGDAKGGYTLVDVTDPKLPVVLEDVRLDENPIGYPVIPAKNRASVLVPATVGTRLVLREYELADKKAVLSGTIDIGDASLLAALGAAYDGDHTAVLALPGQRALAVVDLNAKTARKIDWLPEAGPADVTF